MKLRLLSLVSVLLLLAVGSAATPVAALHPAERVDLPRNQLTVERVAATATSLPVGIESDTDSRTPLDPVLIHYRGAVSGPVGAPALPRLPVWVEVPSGMRVTGIRVEAVGVEPLGRVWVGPVAPDVRPGDEVPEAVPDPAIYGREGIYPAAWAELSESGSLRGHHVVGVEVAPLRWEPATGRLERAEAVNFTLELEPGDGPVGLARHRVVREIEARFEKDAGRLVRGLVPAVAKGTLGVTGSAGQLVGSGPAGPGPFQPTFRPTPDGSAVEYVIVTNDLLAPQFERLAEWKTQKGVQAAVRTVEWIDQTYPNGVDLAERIRFFIRDAYQNWGTLFVLLGGDTDVVPPRYAQMVVYSGERIPSDYYYGCLDGNWNGDGDARFGESLSGGFPGDDIDKMYEVNVGRASVSTVAEATAFVDKTLLYEMDPPDHSLYPASIVALAESLFTFSHGADIAERALAEVPSNFHIARLYEGSANYPGSIELTRQVAIDSINAGFGIIHHVGHGYRNSMSVGLGTLNNADADNLINGPRNSVVFAINCSSASIDFNSIGERFVKNPNGGSIAYIGTSRLAFITPSEFYQDAWYPSVFADSMRVIGTATDLARMVLIPNSNLDTSNRWNLLATTLLGDPEVDIYTNAVIPMQVAHPASVEIGDSMTVTVSAQGAPVESTTVTLWRQGEVYVRATTAADGTAELPVTADTPGSLVLTAHKSYYRPYTATVPVTAASGPYLYVQSFTITDDGTGASSGDGDGMADAGETIELRVTLRNGGSAQATGVTGVLSADDPENALTITVGGVGYGTIAPGGASAGGAPFVIVIDPSAPVAYQPILTITGIASEGSWGDPIALPLRRPYLEHHAHEIDDAAPRGNGNGQVEAGEEIHYRVTLRNTGQDRATGVSGALRALDVSNQQPHPLVTVGDGSSIFGTILPAEEVEGDRFAFTLDGAADPATVLLELTLSDDLGPADLQLLDLLPPLTPTEIVAFGSPTSIRVEWQRSSEDTRGYDIFRSSNPGGPFGRLNARTVDGSAAYEDRNLVPLTRYYYQVVARDSSYNASLPSEVVSGTTNPPFAPGWPTELAQQSQSSAIISNTAGGTDFELFTAADYEYGWHADGTEIRDGDEDERTSGPFTPGGYDSVKGFAATTAIGDLEDDGDLEIVNAAWASDSVYVWDHQGQLVSGWPKWLIEDDFNWPSPVLYDLDGDTDLEVIVWAGRGGRLFAWHHDGTEVIDGDQDPATDGVFYQIDGTDFNYASPAVADIDQDQRPEIIFCVNLSDDMSGEVWALNHDGSRADGWPFATGSLAEPSQVTASPAVGDVDRNGTQEIVIAADRLGGRLYVLNGNGTVRSGWPRPAATRSGQGRVASPVLGDIDGDTFPDIVYPASDGQLYVFDRDGVTLPGFPVTYAVGLIEATQASPSLADIDGDLMLEIIFGDETGKVHAYNHDGSLVDGFPIQLNGEVRSTPIVWDIDLDTQVELAVVGWDANVYMWDLPSEFSPALAPWPFFRHDVRNTGWTLTPPLAVGIADPGTLPSAPAAARLSPPRPNPFNPSTSFDFDVPGEGARPVSIAVYDVSGRLLRRLLEGPVTAGRHSIAWDGRGANGRVLATGTYLIRATIGGQQLTEKVTLVK